MPAKLKNSVHLERDRRHHRIAVQHAENALHIQSHRMTNATATQKLTAQLSGTSVSVYRAGARRLPCACARPTNVASTAAGCIVETVMPTHLPMCSGPAALTSSIANNKAMMKTSSWMT